MIDDTDAITPRAGLIYSRRSSKNGRILSNHILLYIEQINTLKTILDELRESYVSPTLHTFRGERARISTE